MNWVRFSISLCAICLSTQGIAEGVKGDFSVYSECVRFSRSIAQARALVSGVNAQNNWYRAEIKQIVAELDFQREVLSFAGGPVLRRRIEGSEPGFQPFSKYFETASRCSKAIVDCGPVSASVLDHQLDMLMANACRMDYEGKN